MSTLLVVFALNLFGVFEIEFYATRLAAIDQAATGARRSFFEGLLAVVLATPCTAPFLGTAVGFAFASESPVIFAIFGAIGVGLAAPFALITLVPAWSKLVPRSGPWMLKLRAGLGFALLGSAVWLVWIVGRSIGIDGMVTLVGFLVAVSFVTWVYGSVQAVRRRVLTRGIGLALVALVAAGLNTIRLEAGEPAPPTVPRFEQVWQSFDARAIADQLAAGRPVFVSFTADWCITCKVNERFVIAHDRVREEFAQLDVALFRGDWTRRDERIRSELARFGKAGVPMYLIYGPEDPEQPVLLPELLSVERVVDALREAAPASPARG
jgi:thiol:disulfide interchange protein DsbD